MKQVIGPDVAGVLGSDCSAGDKRYQGLHHRCWVPDLRAIPHLKKNSSADEGVLLWATHVKAVSDEAVAWVMLGPDPHLSARKHQQARVAPHQACEQNLWALCQPFTQTQAFQQARCERMECFLPEMVPCVAFPGVPARSHLANRCVRLVITHTIRGDRVVSKDQRLGWGWPVSVAPG